MSSDKDTTESPAEQYIASMVDVPVEEWDPRFRQALTTMFTRASLSTQSTTPSSRQGFQMWPERFYTPPSRPVSSAPTSSNTQRSEESLSYIDKAIDELARTLVAKNMDYKIDGEFSNFEFVTDITGVHPEVVMLSQIAIKLGRLKGLPDDPQNESRLDTIKDLAGYAVILYGYALSLAERDAPCNCSKNYTCQDCALRKAYDAERA